MRILLEQLIRGIIISIRELGAKVNVTVNVTIN